MAQKTEKRIKELEATVKHKDEKIDRLEARLARYENRHTPHGEQPSQYSLLPYLFAMWLSSTTALGAQGIPRDG